jgi:hypothetical protein
MGSEPSNDTNLKPILAPAQRGGLQNGNRSESQALTQI